MKELSRRSPEFFRIETGPSTTPNDSAPSARRHFDWSSVSQILHDGVGLSTLPCIKLRAIVDAAREIFRILSEEASAAENTNSPMEMDPNGNNNVTIRTSRSSLGADDFLPIFIYCVVQAEMERPCALCVLLRTLCDRTSKIGEMGYYLMSFEAVIKHCEEVDLLDEEREEMPSFLSIPLDDN
jgi:Vacuolar sorting protein 9 (VPS9) domain